MSRSQEAGHFILHRDDLDRIFIVCTDCHDEMLVEDILDFRMYRSRWLGQLRSRIYTLKNMIRVTMFTRLHQHRGDEE